MVVILVTGSEGFIGKHIVHSLRKTGYVVHTYDLINNQNLKDRDALVLALEKVSIVIHAAGIGKPQINEEFDMYWESNNVVTKILAETCIEHKISKFIYLSSTSYYGAEQHVPISFPLTKKSPTLSAIAEKYNIKTTADNIYYSVSKALLSNSLTKQSADRRTVLGKTKGFFGST